MTDDEEQEIARRMHDQREPFPLTEEERTADAALVELIEMVDCVMLEVKGKRVALGRDIQADIVRLMRAGLEKP